MALSFLSALAFAWSFAVAAERVDDVWRILRLASAAVLVLSLLRLVLMLTSSRRLRRRQDGERRTEGTEGAEMQAEGQPSEEKEEPTEEHGPTYEEIFGQVDPDEGVSMAAEGQPSEEELPTEVVAPDAHVDPQEHLLRIREEFRARAEEAALRVKQREAELQKVASAPDAER